MVPAKKRPSGEALPSLKRFSARFGSGLASSLKSPVAKSNRCNPVFSATTARPFLVSAKEPIGAGMRHALVAPVAGSNRLRLGPWMSIQ